MQQGEYQNWQGCASLSSSTAIVQIGASEFDRFEGLGVCHRCNPRALLPQLNSTHTCFVLSLAFFKGTKQVTSITIGRRRLRHCPICSQVFLDALRISKTSSFRGPLAAWAHCFPRRHMRQIYNRKGLDQVFCKSRNVKHAQDLRRLYRDLCGEAAPRATSANAMRFASTSVPRYIHASLESMMTSRACHHHHPQSVAEHYAKEWKREWRGEDTISFDKETSSIRDLRDKHVAEAHEWARNLDLSAASVRKACLSFPSKTAIGLDQHAFKDIALLPDNALGSLGEIVRQCFVKLAIPTQSLLQLLVLLGKKNGGSRTIAILHTTYRLTMRLVSAHISQWDVNFAGKWDSALKGNSALRAHVARAMGIKLAHSEGQYVIHFLWDMRKFYDSIKAARGYPLEILVLGTLTHK